MTPEQVSILQTIAFILDKFGTLPIGGFFFMLVIGPWVFAALLFMSQKKRDEVRDKEFDGVKRMYENNVELVKGFENMARNYQDLILMCAQAMTEVRDAADNNLFCPLVKGGTKPKGPTS